MASTQLQSDSLSISLPSVAPAPCLFLVVLGKFGCRDITHLPHVRESGFQNLGNPVESWALESGIQLKESEIPLTNGIHNPSPTDKN